MKVSPENKMQSISCRFTKETLERIRSKASELDLPVSGVINMAVRLWLDQQDLQKQMQDKVLNDQTLTNMLLEALSEKKGD